jgi:hypothetical protein
MMPMEGATKLFRYRSTSLSATRLGIIGEANSYGLEK